MNFPCGVVPYTLVFEFPNVLAEGGLIFGVFVSEGEGMVVVPFFEGCACHADVVLLVVVGSCDRSLVNYTLNFTLPA